MGGEKREARAPKRRQVAVDKRVGSRRRMFGRRVNDGRRKMASVALAPHSRSASCFENRPPDGDADTNCGRNGPEFGASQQALRVDPSRLPSKIGAGRTSDHGLFYFARRGSETVRRYKNVSLYFCARHKAGKAGDAPGENDRRSGRTSDSIRNPTGTSKERKGQKPHP